MNICGNQRLRKIGLYEPLFLTNSYDIFHWSPGIFNWLGEKNCVSVKIKGQKFCFALRDILWLKVISEAKNQNIIQLDNLS